MICAQVGPVWNVSSSQFGAKFQIYVSAQANQSFTAPYTVTLSGPVAYSSVQPWGWNAAITPEGQVRNIFSYCQASTSAPSSSISVNILNTYKASHNNQAGMSLCAPRPLRAKERCSG